MSIKAETPLDTIFDTSSLDTVAESPVSYVSRAVFRGDHPLHASQVAALKSASVSRKFSKQPHDIIKEAKLLASLSHANIIELLGSTYEPSTRSIHFWMPFVQYSLHELLSSPTFSPHPFPTADHPTTVKHFVVVVRSIVFQLFTAVAYLHEKEVAHRDLKPRNVLITTEGCLKLIDFGISWDTQFSAASETLWPETKDKMCAHVCTGPYRAPETIFGPTLYNPFAIDLWSAGALCAELFTCIRFVDDEDGDEQDDELVDDEKAFPPFVFPADFTLRRGYWSRDSLFNAARGSIGLAWSIFKTRGTPNEENWPGFQSLPDASKVTFQEALPIDLARRLPNLPVGHATVATASYFPPDDQQSSPLDLIHRLLVYPPEKRLSAHDALQHPWLRTGPFLLPPGYDAIHHADSAAYASAEADQKSLGELTRDYLQFPTPESPLAHP